MTRNDSIAARGGDARAASLSPGERSDIARTAAQARWAKKEEPADLPRATHDGVVKIGNAEIPCAVLEDGRRLLTQQGFLQAIGRARSAKGGQGASGDNLPAFLAAKNIKPFIDSDLVTSTKPVIFRSTKGIRAYGYLAELLPKVCTVYLEARDEGALQAKQLPIADVCAILVRGLAQTGIVALVDEATGYQGVRPKEALQEYLSLIIRKELAAWVKKFPDEFYKNIYALKGWVWPGMGKNRYSVVGHYTNDLVFERLAPGLLSELKAKTPKDERGHRPNKLHQWLNEEVGDPMLAQHLHALIMLQRLAIANGHGWHRFVKSVDQVLPRRGATLQLPLPEPDQETNGKGVNAQHSDTPHTARLR